MKRNWMSWRMAAIVALSIAVTAFALGQFVKGAGVIFVIMASTMWTAYSASRQSRLERKNV
ncbi:hypothetical protein SAMN05444678_10977 [Sphingomonas sp. YR710]|jgi:hypothetical protein|nr:hypothetical protein SAMN05444678_10977 [Sphingomonas sp. YR710]